MSHFFNLNPIITKPYALIDLDDTLFQTLRKLPSDIDKNKLTTATINKQGEPLSFFTPKQALFFNWLYHATELIAVTARDTSEIKRVKLPFKSWQILTHGAVIVNPTGEIIGDWQEIIAIQLYKLQNHLNHIYEICQKFDELILTLHTENFIINQQSNSLNVYLAIKHKHKDHQALIDFANQLPTLLGELGDEFYVHVNANNLAILPHAVHKYNATRFLLENYLEKDRPCFGFGDSLADLGFLQLLDWYGTPNKGQLHDFFSQSF